MENDIFFLFIWWLRYYLTSYINLDKILFPDDFEGHTFNIDIMYLNNFSWMLILKFDFRKTKDKVGYKSLTHILTLNNNKKTSQCK
jgi:hypothetical protein